MAGVSFAATRREAEAGEQEAPAQAQGPQIVDAEAPATQQARAPWELLAPLALGSEVANGWSAAGLTGVSDGSCVLTLKNQRGREHRIHLCRNDGTPQGLVYTKRLDLVVMNGGRGDLPTEEGLAQAVAEVAHVLAENESKHQVEPVIADLMAQADRVSRFSGDDRRLR
jgi:hypothetical protein